MSWRYVSASVVGTSHQRDDRPCQDANCCGTLETNASPIFFAIVSDGAGSAQASEVGAKTVTDYMQKRVRGWLRRRGDKDPLPDEDVVRGWVARARGHLIKIAEESDLPVRQLACTLMGIVATSAAAICFQVGDGAIVLHCESGYQVPIWPDNGEYANTTFFVTESHVLDHLHFVRLDCPVLAVALMTDGMERLALNFSAHNVHEPFFAPLFGRLSAEPTGYAESLREPLQTFLSSPAVNTRTDDDKTLVLASLSASQP